MNRQTIVLLEDDADRVRGFESAVAQLGSAYRLRMWRDAHRMMAECHEVLADAALISLDHDLNKETPESPDPGDGLVVASFLARLPCLCPVILHTSNTDRVWSMHNEFRFGGWVAEHVTPLGTEWIKQSWLTDLVLNPDANDGYGAPIGFMVTSPMHIYPGLVGR